MPSFVLLATAPPAPSVPEAALGGPTRGSKHHNHPTTPNAMTDTAMTFVPTHLRHVPFGLAFTLNADDDLMCVKLREDISFSKDLEDYQPVELTDMWSEEEQDTLMLIHQTLMGEA